MSAENHIWHVVGAPSEVATTLVAVLLPSSQWQRGDRYQVSVALGPFCPVGPCLVSPLALARAPWAPGNAGARPRVHQAGDGGGCQPWQGLASGSG